MGVETWIQEGIANKLRVTLPERMRVAGMGGIEGGSGLANAAAQIFVGHVKSRATAKNQQPYDEIETLIYEVRVQLKALKGSTGAPDPLELDTDMMNLLGAVKGCLRGFKPVHPVLLPITISSVDLKGYSNGTWDWSVLAQMMLRRFEGEQFRQLRPEEWGGNANDTPLPFPIENLVIRSGVYRGRTGDIDDNVLDRTLDIYRGEGVDA